MAKSQEAVLESSAVGITTAGKSVGEDIKVSIGARFLQLFSEQLYTSPNKAFEELVTNSWDAGASVAYIGIPDNLKDERAALWVLDDGVSMDLGGLQLLWAVADDHKTRPEWPQPAGREQIGMFGIGKLATYVLADEVTYVCRDAAGVIRAVTVDYRSIRDRGEGELHVAEVPFPVRELTQDELPAMLASIDPVLVGLLDGGRVADPPATEGEEAESGSEFQDDEESQADEAARNTWTLAVLTSLKDRGRSVSRGMVRNVLRAALPLSDEIKLVIGDEVLRSKKLDVQLLAKFVIGKDFKPETVDTESSSGDDGEKDTRKVTVTTRGSHPALEIEGLPGVVTGEIQIYTNSIAGGRSAERARSHGFFVNVRRRVINLHEERFGLPALSHSVWAKLRITLRADGLNDSLSVSRETVEETDAVDVVRGLMRAAFNHARTHYEAHATWPSLTDILTDKWGTVPLTPLLHAASKAVAGEIESGVLIDVSKVDDPETAMRDLQDEIKDSPGKTLREVKADRLGSDAPLAMYQLSTRTVVINSDHPYYVEQIRGRHEKQEILQTAELIALLSDAYLLELGVPDYQVAEVREYRDKVGRLIAKAQRRSAPMLAHALLDATTDDKALEAVVRDCLDFLGFEMVHQAQPNKPEGIATANLAPGQDNVERRYRLIYEAKSTTNAEAKVSTKDVNVSGQDRHRRLAAGDTDDPTEVEYALVVAPGFRGGALEDECERLGVCPMRARDLARLLMGVSATGPLNLEWFREVLQQTDPDETARAVDKLIEEAQGHVSITITELVTALAEFDNVDQLSTSIVAEKMRSQRSDGHPKEPEVQSLVWGLERLVPSAVQTIGKDRFVLGTSPARLGEAIRVQAAELPDEHRFNLDDLPPLELGKESDGGED